MPGGKIKLDRANQTDLFESTAPAGHQSLSDAQRLDWLRLVRTQGIGPVTFRDLLNHFGTASAALEAIEERQFGKRRFDIYSITEAETELEIAARSGARLVGLNEQGYPRWLQSIDGAPPLLFVQGDGGLSERPSVAIVGSRQASAAGLKFTQHLATELAMAGFVITSGLARGIDREAHLAALEHGTIAVLGGGIDHVYPSENKQLYKDIGQNGLLVSERPMGYRPVGKDFPRRNRLISGISLGVVVVEAAMRSGSLTTARFAGEQGRIVFAVPGHPLDPRAVGTNKLIKEGASLVSEIDDVLAQISTQTANPGLAEPEQSSLFYPDSAHSGAGDIVSTNEDDAVTGKDNTAAQQDYEALRVRLLELLGPTPVDRDSLTRLLDCETRHLQVVLLELDLEGRIHHHGEQRVSLTC